MSLGFSALSAEPLGSFGEVEDALIEGVLAAQEQGDVSAVTGTVLLEGDILAQESPDTLSVFGGSVSNGSLLTVEAGDTAVFAGGIITLGNITSQEEPDIGFFNGGLGIQGQVLVQEQGQDSFVGQAEVITFGSVAVQESAADSFVIDVDAFISASFVLTEPNDGASVTGEVLIQGSINSVESPDSFVSSYLADYITPEGNYSLVNLSPYYDIEVINVD